MFNNLYNPGQFNPTMPGYNNPYSVNNQRISLINKVNGFESAKAFQTQPNTEVVLFDANEDIFYIKTTDASNYPSIRAFKFTEIKNPGNPEADNYVTKEEFDRFKKELLDGKQYIWRESKPNGKSNKQHSNDKVNDVSSEQFSKSSTSYSTDASE